MQAERKQVHFIDNLNYLLTWPLSADEIAKHLGCNASANVEKRFERMGITDTEIAEQYRRRKPGYCPECRMVQEQHRATCTAFVPYRGYAGMPMVEGKRRRKRVAA